LITVFVPSTFDYRNAISTQDNALATPKKQMKAAILNEMGRSRPYANSKPLVVEDVDLDPPGTGELLIKIKATGLCHSDLSVINGDRPRPMPMVLGH
jgi:alcohol dehydrogenase